MADHKLFGHAGDAAANGKRRDADASVGKTERVAKLRRVFMALEPEERVEFLRMIAPAMLERGLGAFADGRQRSDAALNAAAQKSKPDRRREARRAPRRAVQRRAMILAAQSAFSIECVILDESRTGVRVQSREIFEAPTTCRLMEPYAAAARLCRIVWRAGDLAGLAFLD